MQLCPLMRLEALAGVMLFIAFSLVALKTESIAVGFTSAFTGWGSCLTNDPANCDELYV